MYFCGLDVGTSGVKAVVMDEKGKIAASSYEGYVLELKSDGTRDLSPGEMWDKTKKVLKDVAAVCKNISALAVSTFGEAFVLADERGNPLSEVMIYTDRRGEKEYFEAIKSASDKEIAQICGLSLSPVYSLSKILYLKQNRPEIYEKAKYLLLMEDFIYFKLTGEAVTDHSLAHRTMLYDITKRQWSDTLLEKFGVRKDFLSQPVTSGTVVGNILSTVAKEIDLNADMKVVVGGHDQPICAYSTGLRPGSVVCSMGTSECMTPVFEKRIDPKVTISSTFSTEPFLTENKYCTLAYNVTSGILIKWFFDVFAENDMAGSKKPPYGLFEEKAPKAPTKMLVQPYLMGSGTPYMDHRARFAIIGGDIGATRYDIYKAVIEGLCMDQRLNADILEKQGIRAENIICVGGGSNSRLWLQTKADIMGVPVHTMETTEAGALGCVMICAVALGVYKDSLEAAENMSRLKDIFIPNSEHKKFYDEKFVLYKQLHGDIDIYSKFATK